MYHHILLAGVLSFDCTCVMCCELNSLEKNSLMK